MPLENSAAEVHGIMVERFNRFQNMLPDNESVLFTFFFPTREVRMFVSQVSVPQNEMLGIFGEDMDGNTLELTMHWRHLAYMLEGAKSDSPRRIGI